MTEATGVHGSRLWRRAVVFVVGLAAAIVATVTVPRAEPPSADSNRSRFHRYEVCLTCRSYRSSRGTDLVREAGEELLEPAFEVKQTHASPIMRSGLLNGVHTHVWNVVLEDVVFRGKVSYKHNSWNYGSDVIETNLLHSGSVRRCLAQAIGRGEVSRGELEAVLRPRFGSAVESDAVRESRRRILSILRECPEWAEWLR
jgi:hypothetical protein